MKQTQYSTAVNCNLLKIDQAVSYFNLNPQMIKKLAAECGAKLKIGRSARYQRDKLEEYLKRFEV